MRLNVSILPAFLLFITLKMHAQPLPVKETIYSFVNETVKIPEGTSFNLAEYPELWHIVSDSGAYMRDTLFSAADRAYFRLQLAQMEAFRWDEAALQGIRVIPQRKLKRIFRNGYGWETFRKHYGNCLTHMSVPLFTLDGNYCIVQRGTQCDWLAGSGCTRVYRKVAGKWVDVGNYSIWIS